MQTRDSLGPEMRIVYLENYDWELGSLLTSGMDLWLNTPLPPMEASGTSGMKAALNGVPVSACSTAGGSRAASKAYSICLKKGRPQGRDV